ncbi:MAG: hypothetical protein O2968_16215 [Acidobacteria bacterium]|nr:hypothetical protein [Acidobacteriota bacterium]
MTEPQQITVLLQLADELRKHGSWCGETHIQKASYFLQEMLAVPTDYDFILYKHGPFSFDLRDELALLRADGLLEIELRAYPYSPSLVVTQGAERFRQRHPETLRRYADQISFVADKLESKGVTKLERLATALYVSLEAGAGSSEQDRAQRLVKLKPHVSLQQAQEAVETVKRFQEEADCRADRTGLAGAG